MLTSPLAPDVTTEDIGTGRGPDLGYDTLRGEVRAALAGWRRDGVFTPQVDSWCRGFDNEFSRRLAARGWVGMTVPAQYGGSGRTPRERYVVAEELLAAGAPVTAHWVADRQVAPMLLRIGTEEQRARLLPAITRAEASFVIGMSEPNSGSDLASIRTRATRDERGWIVNGQKIWSTGAHLLDYMIALVRTSGTPADRHAGLSQLLIDLHAPGVEVRPIAAMNGRAEFCEVFFTDVAVPQENVIGEIGAGWKQVMTELTFERSGPDRFMSTYLLLQRLNELVNGDHGSSAVSAQVGRLVARLAAIRSLSMDVMLVPDGSSASLEVAMAKEAGTTFEQESIELVRTAKEEAGLDDPALDDMLDDLTLTAPMITIRGGTTEILRGVIARSLLS
jgi:acyl-CoA dehydrogenase